MSTKSYLHKSYIAIYLLSQSYQPWHSNKRPLDKIPNCQHTTILVTSIKNKMSDMLMAIYKVIVDELSCHLYISMQ